MSTAEDRKKQLQLSNAYMAGEKIFNVKFRHNSQISFVDEAGEKAEGWIVGVGPVEPEPVYTVERSDGEGGEEVKESLIELLSDPHEN